MGRIIRLDESDIIRIVKKVIVEQSSGEQTKEELIYEFIEKFIEANPQIEVTEGEDPTEENTLPITEFNTFINKNKNVLPNLSLNDLDLLSEPRSPVRINYYQVGSPFNYEGMGPMKIININYSTAINKRNINFNFTRITGVNTFGVNLPLP